MNARIALATGVMALCAVIPGIALAQTAISVENTGVVERPMVEGQVLPETHRVHTIGWTDSGSLSGETYNVYVSNAVITDVRAANVYRIGTGVPEGQQAFEYALLTPFTPGPVQNYYAVTSVSSSGAENTAITAGQNATRGATSGTTEYGQPMYWFTEEPIIDAEFDDWPFAPVFMDPTSPEFWTNAEIEGGLSDLSGNVAMGINDVDLFTRAEVTDNALVNVNPTGDGSVWQGDAVETYIGLYDLRPSTQRHPTARWGNESDPTKAEPDWQLDIAGNAFDDPNRSQNFCAGTCGSYQTGMGNIGLEVLTKKTAVGWNVEARLPLEGLAQDPAVIAPFQPKIGMILGCTFALADGDDPAGGRQGQLFWGTDLSLNNAWNTPAAWEKEQVIYDPKVFGLGGPGTAVEASSWGRVKASLR